MTTPDATDTSTTEPAADKATTADLVNGFVLTFATTDDGGAALADIVSAYRAIPAAARGGAVSKAMLQAIQSGMGEDMLTPRLDAINNLPATSTSRVKVDITPDEANMLRSAAVYEWLGHEVGTADGFAEHRSIIERHADAYKATVEKIAKAINAISVGDRTRTTIEGGILDVAPAGTVLSGTHKGATYEAIVNEDGTLTSGDVTGSVSTVATKVSGQKAVNGWRFWTFNGSTLAKLRAGSDA